MKEIFNKYNAKYIRKRSFLNAVFGKPEREGEKTFQGDGVHDDDVKKALEDYECTVNRYNNLDLSNPSVENVFFLERQAAFVRLQVALAKARLRQGREPALDYSHFESLTRTVGVG